MTRQFLMLRPCLEGSMVVRIGWLIKLQASALLPPTFLPLEDLELIFKFKMLDSLSKEEKKFVQVPRDVLKASISSREDMIELLIKQCKLLSLQASSTSRIQPKYRSGS